MDDTRLSVRYLSEIGIHYDDEVEHIVYIHTHHVKLSEWVSFLRSSSSLGDLTLFSHLLQDRFSLVYCR